MEGAKCSEARSNLGNTAWRNEALQDRPVSAGAVFYLRRFQRHHPGLRDLYPQGVAVQKGARVFRGQTLVVLEFMKMENGVASPVDGVGLRKRCLQASPYFEYVLRIHPLSIPNKHYDPWTRTVCGRHYTAV
jgi:hypothetical protein